MPRRQNYATPDRSMQDSLALGIDLGTSGVRVAVLNEQRELLYTDSTEYDRGLAYPDDWLNNCIQLISAIPQELRSQVMAIAVDGTSGTLLACDRQGTPHGKALPYIINQTMMRVDIPQPLKSKEQISFSIKWSYNIPDHTVNRARSGYEYFAKDGNRAYVIAQFFPRMAVYSDVEGWQNHQFWGSGEFALPFGNYEVNITVPADHVLDATGTLQNRKDVFSKEMMSRYEKAKKSYDKPVIIVSQEEAEAAEKNFSTKILNS